MSMETDGQLVARCRRGDLTAFEALVERHRATIVALAYSRLGCFADAEDIAQEAFVHAFFRLPQLREAEKFMPWLRSITARFCLMHLRRRREECIEPGETERLSAVEASHDDSRLEEALAKLPEAMQLTIRLTYLHGYTTTEAAEILGVRRGTIKSRLGRARAALRKELGIMGEREPSSAFMNEVTERLMERARELLERGEYEAAEESLDEVLNVQFEHGSRFDPEAVRMAESVWEQMRQRNAEANARQYGKHLEDLDWKVGKFNTLSNSLAHPGGEGQDIWGVPRGAKSVLDARDICRRLKVSPTTLHRWIQQGMPVIRYRPWVRFGYDRVKAWLSEQGITPRPEITLAQASHPLRFLFAEIEADRLTAKQAERILRELDLPPV